jgi:formylglycine-generating enzyme required for sulfatase activity
MEAPQVIEFPLTLSRATDNYDTRAKRTLFVREKGTKDHYLQTRRKFDVGKSRNKVGPELVLWVDWLEIERAPTADRQTPPGIAALGIPLDDKSPEPSASDLRTGIERFAAEAFRGQPVPPTFVDKLLGIYDLRRKAGNKHAAALKETLSLVLASPGFLYLAEPSDDAARRPLTGPELAMRLSYFLWGSPPDEAGRSANETAVEAEITRGFLLSRTEVTQAQWLLMMEDNPSEFRGALNPVENVSWHEAIDFCANLTAKAREEGLLPEGWKFTLPTEAQWEYACRAGTTTALPIGRNLDSDKGADKGLAEIAWHHDNAGLTTQPAGLKASNAWGFHDMLGNVWEWCLDSHAETLPGGADPLRADEGDRVIRGGAWSNLTRGCRSARRSWLAPDSRQNDLGFRVACVYGPEPAETAPAPASAKPEAKPESKPTSTKP